MRTVPADAAAASSQPTSGSAVPPPSSAPSAPAAPSARAAPAAPPAAKMAQGAIASIAPGRGLAVRTRDGSSAMTVRARLKLRDTVSVASETTNELNIKTARLGAAKSTHRVRPQLEATF